MNLNETLSQYLKEIEDQFNTGHAIEHAYRPALKVLMSSFEDTIAVNDPKHSEHGAPDFVFLKKSNTKLIQGYAEAKDITVSLDKTEKSSQMERYSGYANLFLTDYLEFRFFKNGEKYQTVSLGHVKNGELLLTPENGNQLLHELQAFLELPPEKIRSGKRLAQIMGGKARRIRDNVAVYLNDKGNTKNSELEKIYTMMKELLVHDLSQEKFADMYAQTLVYGLFVARYGDSTPESFDRREARDLVPKSNPFLRHFFDHIVGPDFDVRLGYIVDELCEVFSVSNVQEIVHKHLRIADKTTDAKDPIIHFYEDFLNEYDPAERKRMGAYYTPIPVVQFIVRQVDEILKRDFGITKGLASAETFTRKVDIGQEVSVVKAGNVKATKTSIVEKEFHRVQILDPAVGTATFLNEIIKYIHEGFKGQEGRWPAYVKDNLVKRLHGFELMMAPYTIAHLKLGMTFKETGVEDLGDRLGIYLTNTLEEGVSVQQDLFSFGLAQAVSDESKHAADIKIERPIMVVIGNPPYAVESSNKTDYATKLVEKYKVEPGGRQRLQERNSKMLNDDYVKFIAFAEDMIQKNSEGAVAMITNNGFIDNPTFRGMRWHLCKTFDSIYVLDLHGNSKKGEVTPDGTKDENVFDIQQGVSIILGVKMATTDMIKVADVYASDLFGTRKNKFKQLAEEVKWRKVQLDPESYVFAIRDTKNKQEYDNGVKLDELFIVKAAGIKTSTDSVSIGFNDEELKQQVVNSGAVIIDEYDERKVKKILYRPFDKRKIYYDSQLVKRDRYQQMKHSMKDNLAILSGRQSKNGIISQYLITDGLSEMKTAESTTGSYHFSLYLYHDDGTRTENFVPDKLKKLTEYLTIKPTPIETLDYIYGTLYLIDYREKYKVFLRSDFPKIPIPINDTVFENIVKFGEKLRNLHLMKGQEASFKTTYPIEGANIVESIKFTDGSVHINSSQYFGKVPEVAWNFYIGGYQPAQKWLKDRKGRKLSNDDIEHYQKIIKILVETDDLMKQVDTTISL